MKKMKVIAIVLAAVLCMGLLSGCGSFSAADLVKNNLDLIYLNQYRPIRSMRAVWRSRRSISPTRSTLIWISAATRYASRSSTCTVRYTPTASMK